MTTLHEVHTLLMRLDFPATKDEIIRQLTHLEAPAALIERLHMLPEHFYGSVDAVLDALRNME